MWTSDITYIPTDEGWLYLTGVIDLYARLVVGWSMTSHMETSLVTDALRMAWFRRRPLLPWGRDGAEGSLFLERAGNGGTPGRAQANRTPPGYRGSWNSQVKPEGSWTNTWSLLTTPSS